VNDIETSHKQYHTQTIDNNTTKRYIKFTSVFSGKVVDRGELAGMAMGTALSHLDRSLEM